LDTEPPKRIAIFAATSWEVEAVRAAFSPGVERHINGLPVHFYTIGTREFWLARTGVGQEKAGHIAGRLLTYQGFSLAISTGFACALVTAEIGALLVGSEVEFVPAPGSRRSATIEMPGVEREMVLALVERSKQGAHVGRFVSTDHIIGTASEKQQFANATGAIGLDMESAAVAAEARRAQVPFVIVRAASDLVNENLPLDFNLFLRPTGWLQGVAAVLGAPSSLLGLHRLRRQSHAASATLTRFFRHYAQGMWE
jgi:adenosylhomocysteine nucleosidase